MTHPIEGSAHDWGSRKKRKAVPHKADHSLAAGYQQGMLPDADRSLIWTGCPDVRYLACVPQAKVQGEHLFVIKRRSIFSKIQIQGFA